MSSPLVDLQRKRFDTNKENSNNGFDLQRASPGRSQRDVSSGRKILGERNVVSLPDSPIGKSPLKIRCNPLYDPVSNCFSSRPNRRQEILLQSKELRSDEDGDSIISMGNLLGNGKSEEDSTLRDLDDGHTAEDCDENCETVEDGSTNFGCRLVRRAVLLLSLLFLSSCYMFASDSPQKLSYGEFQCLDGDYLMYYAMGNRIDKCLVGNLEVLEGVANTLNAYLMTMNIEVAGETEVLAIKAPVEDGKNLDADNMTGEGLEITKDLGEMCKTEELSDVIDRVLADGSIGSVGSVALLEQAGKNGGIVLAGTGERYELAYARYDWYWSEVQDEEEVPEFDGLYGNGPSMSLPGLEFAYSVLHIWKADLNVGELFTSRVILAVSGMLVLGVLVFLFFKSRKYSTKKPLPDLQPVSSGCIVKTTKVASKRDEYREISSSRLPTVKLLGEFSVAGVAAGRERKEKDQSFSTNRRSVLPDPQRQLSVPASTHVAVESESIGTSLGVEKKTSRKKLEGGGEVTSVSKVTPVRRSSRIKKQTVLPY